MSKTKKFELPDTAIDFLRDLIDAYPEEDTPTLRKIMAIGQVKYQDKDLIPGMPMTAAVVNTKPVTLLFGRKFMEEQVDDIKDAVYILSHELTHLVLDHFAKDIMDEFKEKELGFRATHIIVDCQVNATVYNSFSDKSYSEFPRKYYTNVMPYCFFRSDGVPDTDELKALHKKLYSSAGITNKELIDGLMPWFEKQDQGSLDNVLKQLLGNHKDTFKDRGGDQDNTDLSDIAQDLADSYLKKNQQKMEEELQKAAQEGEGEGEGGKEDKESGEKPGGKKAGSGEAPRKALIQKFVDNIDYFNNIKNKLKKKEVVSPSSRIYKAIADYLPKTSIRTVIPNFHDRRTVSIYSKTRRVPIFHKAPKIGSPIIIPCYLDVSGSQDHVIPYTSKAVILLKKEIGHLVYCFSNSIAETPITSLQRGEYITTGGTDFNPVAEHILKNRFKSAVILTDGEAYMSDENVHNLKRSNVKITVVWTTPNPSRHPLDKVAEKELYLFTREEYNNV